MRHGTGAVRSNGYPPAASCILHQESAFLLGDLGPLTNPESISEMSETVSKLHEVLGLLAHASKPPEEGCPVGATDLQLSELGNFLEFDIPDELRQWLTMCNGTHAGPGGIYGTNTGNEDLNIEWNINLYGGWKSKRWVPIAGDGAGNSYIIDASRKYMDTEAVYFVDVMESVDKVSYVVASGVSEFLWFLLSRESGIIGWPFGREYVIDHDPAILTIKEPRILPWMAG